MLHIPITVEVDEAAMVVGMNDTRDTRHLTIRESQVLDLICKRLTNKEIANELNLSVRTVKFHVSSLIEKYECKSGRMELAMRFTPKEIVSILQ